MVQGPLLSGAVSLVLPPPHLLGCPVEPSEHRQDLLLDFDPAPHMCPPPDHDPQRSHAQVTQGALSSGAVSWEEPPPHLPPPLVSSEQRQLLLLLFVPDPQE